MKKLPITLLIAASAALLSCKVANQTSDLKVTIAPSPATALPVDINSCGSPDSADLKAPSFSFRTFNFQWNGSNELKIAFIQIRFKSGLLKGGEYLCTIAGDELDEVLSAQKDGIAGGDARVYESPCGLRCGAFGVLDTVNSGYFNGTAKIVGTETDSEGTATPVVTEAEVAVQYTKF